MSGTGAPPADRNAALDALRVLSILGIVTLHVAAGGFQSDRPLGFVLDELSRFAVPVFFILSAYFWKPAELEQPFRLVGRVFRRVGVPFAVWLLLTIAWNMLFRSGEGIDLSPGGLALTLWTGGPAYHLWFLPALIVGTTITAIAARCFGWRRTAMLALVLFAIGALIGSYMPAFFHRAFPFWVDRNGILFAPVFLVAGVLMRRHRDTLARIPVWLTLPAIAVFALGQLAEGYYLVPRYPMGHDFSLSTLGYGLAVALLFLRLDLRGEIWPVLGRATFTAYLCHVLVIAACVDGLGLGRHSLQVITMTFATSLAIGVAWQSRPSAFRQRAPRTAH